MAYFSQHGDRIKHMTTDQVMYEVHIEHQETEATGEYEVFVGLEAEALEDVPIEMSVKVLPAVSYAVFTLRGQQITSDWPKMIYQDWMAGSGYQVAYAYGLQRYDQRFKGLDRVQESELDVYVPVKG